MADSPLDKVKWPEIVSAVALSDPRMTSAATKYFKKYRFAGRKNRGARVFIHNLVNDLFDPNLSIIDAPRRVNDLIQQHSEANAVENCVNKIKDLEKEGWFRTSDNRFDMLVAWSRIRLDLTPSQILARGDERCLLYEYHRKSPPLSTDAIRALLCLVKLFIHEKSHGDVRIVVLDCYKDKSYEDSDFETGERWIAKQIEKVLDKYDAAYHASADGSPPSLPPTPRTRKLKGRILQISNIGSLKITESRQMVLRFA